MKVSLFFSILFRVAYLLNHLHPSVNFPEAAVAWGGVIQGCARVQEHVS